MNQSTNLIQKLKKEIKSDIFFYRKVGRAITIWGAIEESYNSKYNHLQTKLANKMTLIIKVFNMVTNIN